MPESVCPSCSQPVAPDSAFCGACGSPLVALSSAPTQTSLGRQQSPAGESPFASRATPDGARFLPGQVLAKRYRIIGLIGKGGMGEVYRADDLKLGEPVALKFLPEIFSQDQERLDRFFNEVRTARQVTHPNVCRVHDLDEVDGQHFLSMEYVDGEDLATLLTRVGHVPKERAIQIARQLCAGLGAAHEQGILHRDFKPANVMIDGRGRARITDFGLASLAGSVEGVEVRAGTPAYQAPEQLSGTEVTTASDVYALGLVLYELFTGNKPFKATTAAELVQLQKSSTPTSLSSHVDGLDESIERVIMRCLEVDPNRRPPTALAVSAALPGGDPLAEALAAGETPSPQMVAEAGGEGSLRPGIAVLLLAVVLAGTFGNPLFDRRFSVIARVGLPKPPAELRLTARAVLDEVGFESPAKDTAAGLERDEDYFDWVLDHEESPDRWEALDSLQPRPYYFWYRQSPEWIEPRGWGDLGEAWRIEENSPISDLPGMADVRLDTEGRLLRLQIVPDSSSKATADAPTPPEPAWTPLLQRAALDQESLAPSAPRANPLINCHQQSAWTGHYPGQPKFEFRIEACANGGVPIYFEVFPPWSGSPIVETQEDSTSKVKAVKERGKILGIILISIFWSAIVGAALLARRNLRLGRSDRRGALRIVLFLLLVTVTRSILSAHHALTSKESSILVGALSDGIFFAVLAWIFYIALEPFARRVWPNTLISWSRLLDGRLRSPRIGRDILIGAAFAQFTLIARRLFILIPMWRGEAYVINKGGSLSAISSVPAWLEEVLDGISSSVFAPLVLISILMLFRLFIRRTWLVGAVVASIPITLVGFTAFPLMGPLGPVLIAMIWVPLIFTAVRFGFVALIANGLWGSIDDYILLLDPDSWHFGYDLATLLLYVALAVFAFWTSLGGRKLVKLDLLDD